MEVVGSNLAAPELADVDRWRINIGSTTGQENAGHIRDWIMSNHPTLPVQALHGEGGWMGQGEPSTALHLYQTPGHKVQEVLEGYGKDHPHEEAFAVEPSGFGSMLWPNPYNPNVSGQL